MPVQRTNVASSALARGRAVAAPAAVTDELPDAFDWMNIGYFDEDESGNQTFISLPRGLAIDTMPVAKGNSRMSQQKNGLLDQLKGAFESFEAGAEEFHQIGDTDLFVQLRRGNGYGIEKSEDNSVVRKLKISSRSTETKETKAA